MNLPPGPRPIPLIGNTHQVISTLLPHRCLKILAEKYGPLMHLKLGEISYIIVSSAEMAKEIMKTNDLNFCDRPNLLLSTIWSYNASDIAFSPYGENWRQLRKICTIELLSAKRVESFRPIREEEVSKLVKSTSESEGSIVNLTEMIMSMSCAVIARAAFGKKNKHQQVFKSAMREAMSMLGGLCIADLYPSIKMLQRLSSAKTKMEKLQREVDFILQEIIDEHKSRPIKARKDEDLVDVLLKIQQENDHSQDTLSDENIKSVIQDAFTGGSDTSGVLVLWAISEMMKNTNVMEEAQAEVRRVFDRKGYVDETELHNLVYLKCVIKETFRLHPTAPLLAPRENREMCQINEYDIPAKTRVFVNVWAIGRDPRYWVEAESFRPNRFLNRSIDFKGAFFCKQQNFIQKETSTRSARETNNDTRKDFSTTLLKSKSERE
ncbi:cytochrome P450 71D10 [Trifolium repens]|nr:cytochrome P450 71D10 [Trifolium repens]